MAAVNVANMLRVHRARRPDHEALVDGDLRLTYEELDKAVDRHARALRDAGVGRGDIVAILARNHATYLIEIFALYRLGAVQLPLNWRLHHRELDYIVSHAGATTLLVDEEFEDKAAELETLERVITHGAGGRFPALADLVAAAPDEPVEDADVELDDLARILYTSGTTSRPKGVMHTYQNLHFNQYMQMLELGLTPADRILLTGPLFHVAGLDAPGHGTLSIGATLVVSPTFKGPDIVRLAAAERATGMVLAAQILYDILDFEQLGDYDLSSLRYVIFAGVPVVDRQRFHEAFPGVRGIDTFGMTEITSAACYLDERNQISKIGSQGPAVPFCDVKIVGPDGEELPPGRVGEIAVRGPKVMKGYWRDPEATAEALRDGWLHTGDMASIDEDGYMWFADRKRDMIRSGGENIASAEIERVIAKLPNVAEVAVIGVPDPKWDEVPKAYVIPRGALTADDVLAHCREHLGKFKVPKYVEIVDDLPRNDSGKVLKRLLEDPSAGERVAALNAREEQA